MNFIPLFVLSLITLITITSAIEEEDDEPFDLSDLKMGTPDFDRKKFVDLMLAQKQDPEKLMKVFRAVLLQGYDHDEIIKIFKPVILSSLIDSYVPAQKEALRVIALLAQIKVKHIENEVIRLLIQKFLHSKDPVILKKTLTALAAIIARNQKYRDLTLSLKIDAMLLEIIDIYDNKIKTKDSIVVLREVAEVLKALCLYGDKVPTEKSRTKLAMTIEYFMLGFTDPEIITSVTWAYYLLTMPPTSTQYFLLEDIAKNHIDFLDYEDVGLKFATLMVIESVVEKNKPDQIDLFLSNGLLSKVPKLLEFNGTEVVHQTLIILAQLLKSDRNLVTTFFEADLFPNVIKNMFHKNVEIKNAASLVICFTIPLSTQPQIQDLIEMNAIHGLCHALKFMEKEDRVVYGVIRGYLHMLQHTEKHAKEIYEILDECDGIRILQRLRKHQNETISDTADEVIEIFDHVKLNQLKMEL